MQGPGKQHVADEIIEVIDKHLSDSKLLFPNSIS
jgi:hypothetical protein